MFFIISEILSILRRADPKYPDLFVLTAFTGHYLLGHILVGLKFYYLLGKYFAPAVLIVGTYKHEIGQNAVNSLRRFGVDTSEIVRGGDRIGIYYLEKGASQRASKVIYDRKDSAIAKAAVHEFDWKRIFGDAAWFHFTGITPALSEETAKIWLSCANMWMYA